MALNNLMAVITHYFTQNGSFLSQLRHIYQRQQCSSGNLHCVSKKVPTFKLSITLSNPNRFYNFCTVGKHMRFATKPIWYYPPYRGHVATLPSEIKNSNFLQILSRYGRKCKQVFDNIWFIKMLVSRQTCRLIQRAVKGSKWVEMTYYVSSGTLNPTHSLTHYHVDKLQLYRCVW